MKSKDDKEDRERLLSEFVRQATEEVGTNLRSIVLYGSAAAEDYSPGFSDVNLMCILQRATFEELAALAPVIHWWCRRQKQVVPVFLTVKELEQSADVFAIEFIDMQEWHRVLYGEDLLKRISVDRRLHWAQIEYELRQKLILLRQKLVVSAGEDKQMWRLLALSTSSFATLFRHVLIALGKGGPATKRDTITVLASALGFDSSAMLELLDARQQGKPPGNVAVSDYAKRYLATIEHVLAAVDKITTAPNSGT